MSKVTDDQATTVIACVAIGVLILVALAAAAFLPPLILWAAWLWVAVPVFGCPTLGFWQVFIAWLAITTVGGLIRWVLRGLRGA